jgi:radical SAM superfamily enzyme YgiQ (UPF0313 family)
MAQIVLTTLNANYIHASFGLRYLMANLGLLRGDARLLEFDIQQRAVDVVETLLAQQPRIVGFGVYIWNVQEVTAVVAALKRVRPDIIVVLGGPEVSFETERQEIARLADFVITGEGDLEFATLCRQILAGSPPAQKIIPAKQPDLAQLTLPYEFYDEEDVAHRIIYVEASRGCPFTCEFCLSSLDSSVRQFPLPLLLAELQKLLDRGVNQFKFVDRTFNLNPTVSKGILQFFLERLRPGLFLHFEMVPDRLPEALREIIVQFPPGALQFEVGVQTFDEVAAERISRRQDYARLTDNLRFLREKTGVHIHADLIVGLPGETMEGFAAGFDRLFALGPQEIQVGMLKRLRGTSISRHDEAWQMVYNPLPPYEILQNKLLDFSALQRMRRFARFWDLTGNSGNFLQTTLLICQTNTSAFAAFMKWSEWLYARIGRRHGIALDSLAECLFIYLTQVCGLAPADVAQSLRQDWLNAGRREKPAFLEAFPDNSIPTPVPAKSEVPKRQSRHLGRKHTAPSRQSP